MHLRPLSCLLAALALAAASCGGGSSSASSSTKPAIFVDGDLKGDWIGTFSELGAGDFTAYLRCGVNGHPFEGADGTGRDWTSTYPYSYSVVKPDGEVFMSFLVGRELFYLEGTLTRAGTMSGRYWVATDGLLSEEGDYEFQLSAGGGNFSAVSHLEGGWTGSVSTDAGDSATLSLSLAADGSLVDASRDGVAVDLAASSASLSFSDDGLGRLHAFDLVFVDGSLDQASFALVSNDGMTLEGPVTDSVFGTSHLVLVHD